MSCYRITHTTHYHYTQPVELKPHTLRLCPRSDGSQWLRSFQLNLSPDSTQHSYFLDAQGNTCTHVTFKAPVTSWTIRSVSGVETTRSNPFDYLSEPWAVNLPINYPVVLAASLAPYVNQPFGARAIAPAVIDYAQSLEAEVSGHVGYFLMQLTQRIPQLCDYQQRLTGDPYPPGVTLQKKSGTCRDYAVLFVAICRAVGLAARFVSGYQEGDLETAAHDLHAWAEVYVPGGGWRGFDPTLGLVVADAHIAIAAAASHHQSAPVTGQMKTNQSVETHLNSDIRIEKS